MVQSREILNVPSTREALEWLRALRTTVRSLEATGGGDLSGSASVLGRGIDGAFGELDAAAPIESTHQTIRELSSGVSAATDRLVALGVSRCGGSEEPILSTQEGLRALTGAS